MFPTLRHLLAVVLTLVSGVGVHLVVADGRDADAATTADALAPSAVGAATGRPAAASPTPSRTAAAPSPSPSPSSSPSRSASASAGVTVAEVLPATGRGIPAGATTATLRCTGDAALAARLREALTAGAQTSTSVAAYDELTGTYCGYRDSQTYVSASIVKVATVAALMARRQDQKRSLSSTEKRWAKAAITISDNGAQQALWNALGGASAFQRFARNLGMTRTTAASSGKWGLTLTTAHDQVVLLHAVTHTALLTPANRDLLVGWMRGVVADQRWGVPAYAESPRTVAVKNGWLPYGGSWRVNSIGWVRTADDDYLVAALSSGSGSMGTGTTRVGRAARAVHGVL